MALVKMMSKITAPNPFSVSRVSGRGRPAGLRVAGQGWVRMVLRSADPVAMIASATPVPATGRPRSDRRPSPAVNRGLDQRTALQPFVVASGLIASARPVQTSAAFYIPEAVGVWYGGYLPRPVPMCRALPTGSAPRWKWLDGGLGALRGRIEHSGATESITGQRAGLVWGGYGET
jgi:hypothetical protein